MTGAGRDKSLEPFGELVSDLLFNFELLGLGKVEDGGGFVTVAPVPVPGTLGLLALALTLTAAWGEGRPRKA